jgi:hypothetical protein
MDPYDRANQGRLEVFAAPRPALRPQHAVCIDNAAATGHNRALMKMQVTTL